MFRLVPEALQSVSQVKLARETHKNSHSETAVN